MLFRPLVISALVLLAGGQAGCRQLAGYGSRHEPARDGGVDLPDAARIDGAGDDGPVADGPVADGPDADGPRSDVSPADAPSSEEAQLPADASSDAQALTPPTLVSSYPVQLLNEANSSIAARGIAIDASGNIYVALTVSGSAALLKGYGTSDPRALLVSYDANGAHRWTAALVVSGSGVAPDAVAVLVDGATVYLLASASAATLYDGLGVPLNIIAAGTSQSVLLQLKLNNGAHVAHASLGSKKASGTVVPRALTATGSSAGSIYVTGSTSGDVDFGMGSHPVTGQAFVLARYGKNGLVEQDAVICAGGTSSGEGTALFHTSGRLWLALRYGGAPTCAGVALPNAGNNLALVEIDPSTQAWSLLSTDAATLSVEVFAMTGSAAHLYATGTYSGSGTLWGKGVLTTNTATRGGFVADLDVSNKGAMTVQRLRTFKGMLDVQPSRLTTSALGMPIVGGSSQGAVSLDGFTLASADDGLLFGLDDTGDPLWRVEVRGADQQAVTGLVSIGNAFYAVGTYEGGLFLAGNNYGSTVGLASFIAKFALP